MAKRKLTTFFKQRKRRTSRKLVGRRAVTRYKTVRPTCTRRKMYYFESVNLDPGIGTIASHGWRANSIFDPNYTGTGHQPLGHDELADEYNHYAVEKAVLTATFVHRNPATSGQSSGCVVGVLLDDNAAVPTDVSTMREQNRSTTKILSGSRGMTKITRTFTPNNFFCLKNKDLPTNQTAQFGADPTEGAYFQTVCGGLNTSDDAPVISCIVELEYYVKCYEPKTLLGS